VPEPAELPLIAECRLDVDGLRRQRDRYRALGRHAGSATRGPQQLTVRFDAGVDVGLLVDTIEVERGCCPFFQMTADVERRELIVSVPRAEQDPALDAIVSALAWSPAPPA
jgi:hypothetical protein